MIKIESPFQLLERAPHYLGLGLTPAPFAQLRTRKVTLSGLHVSIEHAGKILDLSTSSAPSDEGFRSRGFGWGRTLVPLARGMGLQQQMLLANGGNTVALSWQLVGDRFAAVRLAATPVFAAEEPTSSEVFNFESESNGGRLTWQPFHRATKIIADTNGRCAPPRPLAETDPEFTAQPNIALPAAFEFSLGRRPAILILAVESEGKSPVDPLIGGFLAELADPRPQAGVCDHLLNLAAA